MDRKKSMGILAVAFLLILIGCGVQYLVKPKNISCEKQIFAMNTIMTFEAYGEKAEEAVDAAIEEMNRLDKLLSTGNDASEISLINKSGEGEVSEDTEKILKRALEIYEQTEGVFDCTIYPLMKVWGFTTKEYHVPTNEELEEVLGLVDSTKINIVDEDMLTDINVQDNKVESDDIAVDDSGIDASGVNDLVTGTSNVSDARLRDTYVQLGTDQEIDLGGIAKGYASDRAIEIFKEYDIESGMVSLGGNVKTLNKNPKGQSWKIGIRNPEGESSDILAVVEVENKAVVTSGGYERYFEENGETYIHIIDPVTGYPAENSLVSVTIVSEDGMLADALSTALYIMGEEKAVEFWQKSDEEFEFVLITDVGDVIVTSGLENSLSFDGEYSVIEK